MVAFKDMLGKPLNIGDVVARPYMWGRSPLIEIRTVEAIKQGKIYLSDSKVPLQCPERLLKLDGEYQ
jgi:hypothetical protein